ncbi:hypothetical protein H5410_001257 [Solanum commersonii]|uniref:Uncharacterized protein n=1 Tax=Solanum commersonii TaxID=4109 RepID=A0A9J6AYL9_SOLCO|nr:hypothetical protein H5410_001257 [Solanum commersonii]
MRYLHDEEVLGLSSIIKKYGSPWTKYGLLKSCVNQIHGNHGSRDFSKPRAQISNSFREKSKVQWPLGSTSYTKLQNLQIAKNTNQSKKIVQLSKDIA